MPDRVVRQDILTSDAVNALTWQAEIFYRRLMSLADDFGRYEARTSLLRASLFPLKLDKVSEPDVVKWLGECSKAGLVRVYTVDTKDYLEILKFGQRLRAMKSKYPLPPASVDNCGHLPADDSNTRPETKGNESESETESETKGGRAEAPAPAPPAPPKPEGGGKLKEKQADMLLRRKAFHASIQTFDGQFSAEILGAFFNYWTEPNKSQTKMRFEMEPTWDMARRLGTWEKNEVNWTKGKSASGSASAERHCNGEEVEYLYQRFLEGAELAKIIQEKHCNFLLQAGLIELNERFVLQAVHQRIRTLTGTNNAGELRMIQAYQSGKWPADPDCQADEPNRARIAKKFALIDYFQKSKMLNRKTITDAHTEDE